MSGKKVILVTGASSGLGQATASLLTRQGHTVYGTSRKRNNEISTEYTMLHLDVRSDESVRVCVNMLMEREGRLDVLVNNAGYELAGALEETSSEEAKEQFETNFFGVARMVKAVLPSMRRQGTGHIINIGSVAGLLGVPFHGFYSASKFALEGFTEALSHEVKPFNIHVSIIEPSFMKTALGTSSRFAAIPIEDYTPTRQQAKRYFEEAMAAGDDPSHTARVILSAIQTPSPKLRYRVGKDATWLPRVKMIVPESAFANRLRQRFRLDEKTDQEV